MRETLAIGLAIWGPILLVVVIATICIPLYLVGIVLQRLGSSILWCGGWIQSKLEELLGRML